MTLPRPLIRLPLAFVCLCLVPGLPQVGRAEPAPPPATRSPREYLNSPRETLKTLYFATVAYDIRPQLMDEAVACLDLGPGSAEAPADSLRLAIELEQILRTLCIPLHGVPEKTERNLVSVLDGNGFQVDLVKGSDGLWRFDRGTIDRIPNMTRAALARVRDQQAERAGLKEDLTDPSATLRRFLIDSIALDFYAGARCLDLSWLPVEERSEKGPVLAQQLAYVMERRGWVFLQEVPNQPSGPAYTWYADKAGRIAVERMRCEDGKEGWLFNKKTVRNIAAMYEQVKDLPVDPRYQRLGVALAPSITASATGARQQRPANVPAQLGSPRALLKNFFRAIDAAETQDSKLIDTLEFLDLQAVPPDDRATQGPKIACKLEAVLRKIRVELSSLPDDWNAPLQVLGEAQNVRLEIVRGKDGCWRFSSGTVGQASAFYDKLTSKDKTESERAAHLDSARDTMATFLSCTRQGDYGRAAQCLDLANFRIGAQEEVGPILAYKLRFVINHIGRVYIQEVPDASDGPRYIFYRGDLGRIVLARQTSGPHKGSWLFTPETTALIEPMFRGALGRPIAEDSAEQAMAASRFWQAPGIWVRERVPAWLQTRVVGLELYQWLGLALSVLLSALAARVLLAEVHRLVAFVLRKCGSVLTKYYVACRLWPLTFVTAWALIFRALTLLDLPARVIDAMLPLKTFGMAGLVAWLGVQTVDLLTAIYMNSELLRPHRNLSDMIVPVSMRSLKGIILLCVAIYVVYQIGEGESLNRFLTGLGVAGLAASLAAQDALKSFFSTLLLIGERSFRIGDHITVGGQEGMVEQVGFRATRLRTPDGSLLTIPNSTIASVPIDNLSVKAFSRCKASVLVNYDTTPERILAMRDQLRDWLTAQPQVRADKVDVSVNRLTEKGVEVTLDLQLNEAGAATEGALKEAINCELLRLCAEETGERKPLTLVGTPQRHAA